MEKYPPVSKEDAMDRGAWSPRKGFNKGRLSQAHRGLLGEEWAAVGKGELLCQQLGPQGQSGR